MIRMWILATMCCLLYQTSTVHAVEATRELDTRTATVTVDLSSPRAISPTLFGHNSEYFNERSAGGGLWDVEKRGPRSGVIDLLRPLRIGCLRFPGGTLSNYYHWADGIGPSPSRGKGCPDWGNHAPELTMEFGVDEFVRFARSLGEPELMITVNVPTETPPKPWMGTAQEAAAWVAYTNATKDNKTVIGKDILGKDWGTAGDWAAKREANGHAEPYRVKYWELGNEVFVHYRDPKQYAAVCREFIKAMKAVDGSIRVGVLGNDFEFAISDSPWNKAVLAETRGAADFLIAHFYLPGIRGGGDGNLTAKDTTRITLVSPDRFRQKLKDLRRQIARAGLSADFGVAITEMSCDLRICSETDKNRLALIRSQQAGVYLVDTLLAFQEAGVEVSNYWTLRGWEWSLMEIDGEKLVPQAAYYAYKLFADHWQSSYCPATVRSGRIELNPERKAEFKTPTHPALVAGASINAERTRLSVMLVNRALDHQTKVTVRTKAGKFIGKTAKLTVMAAKPEAVNTAQTPNTLGLKELPAQLSGTEIQCLLPPCSVGVVTIEGVSQ